MKRSWTILLFFCMAFCLSANAMVAARGPLPRPSGGARYMAIVFLSPECPLCQNYTKLLNELALKYKGRCTVYGVIPGKAYSGAEIAAFRTDYHIGFDLLTDRSFRMVKTLKATTTPEVFLLDDHSRVLYSGLIDNWAASLGVQRTVITEHYLTDALEASLYHHPIKPGRTTPVGCLINTK